MALVTGGDSGIGRAVALLYAREGADVAITALPSEKRDSDETCRAIEAEGRRCIVSKAIFDYRERIDYRDWGIIGAAGLFGDKRRYSYAHEDARAEPDRSRHPRQLRCARSGASGSWGRDDRRLDRRRNAFTFSEGSESRRRISRGPYSLAM